jgi:hypothetical protein
MSGGSGELTPVVITTSTLDGSGGYEFWQGVILQAVQNSSISDAVGGHVYTLSPGDMPKDEELNGTSTNPNLTKACLGITTRALMSSLSGISKNEHLISFMVTADSLSGRNTATYAAYIINLVYELIKTDIYQSMDGVNFQVNFRRPFKILPAFDQNFPSRANVSLTCTAFYLSS